jgi:hypothetical protein
MVSQSKLKEHICHLSYILIMKGEETIAFGRSCIARCF